jgi:hypothetical protein
MDLVPAEVWESLPESASASDTLRYRSDDPRGSIRFPGFGSGQYGTRIFFKASSGFPCIFPWFSFYTSKGG